MLEGKLGLFFLSLASSLLTTTWDIIGMAQEKYKKLSALENIMLWNIITAFEILQWR